MKLYLTLFVDIFLYCNIIMFNFWKLKNLYFLVHWRVTYFHNNNTHFLKMSNFFDFSQINIFQIKKKKFEPIFFRSIFWHFLKSFSDWTIVWNCHWLKRLLFCECSSRKKEFISPFDLVDNATLIWTNLETSEQN
jgi:hypothetical protein